MKILFITEDAGSTAENFWDPGGRKFFGDFFYFLDSIWVSLAPLSLAD
jgi:hypothetical protein